MLALEEEADRFARGAGDRPRAADHLAELYFAMKRQGVTLWTVRTGEIDGIRAMIEGERSHGESDRKRQNVRDGLARRKASGKPVGAIPLGFTWEHRRRRQQRPRDRPGHRPDRRADLRLRGGRWLLR